MFQKPIIKFKTKKGREIEIWPPSLDRVSALLEFVNRLIAEDTFLSLTGRPKTYAEEENWIRNILLNIKAGRNFTIWAVDREKIIASVDVNRGGTRNWHVGKIGLMVDKDYRSDGIGRFLLESILKKAKDIGIKIAVLNSFASNEIAIALYEKTGFKECARLPNGLYRKKKYSDDIMMYKDLSSFATHFAKASRAKKASEDK